VILRNILLGMLAGRPMSGYDLSKLFERFLEHLWSARHSQIYPLLADLVEDGLIRQSGSGPRGRKIYEITDAGLAELRAWLTETEPGRTVRDEATLRSSLLWLLEPAQARDYLDREVAYHDAQLAHYRQLAASSTTTTAAERAMRVAVEAGLRHEQAMSEWARWASDQLATAG
jgi:DNA-binding PadR family transcriptional regulator